MWNGLLSRGRNLFECVGVVLLPVGHHAVWDELLPQRGCLRRRRQRDVWVPRGHRDLSQRRLASLLLLRDTMRLVLPGSVVLRDFDALRGRNHDHDLLRGTSRLRNALLSGDRVLQLEHDVPDPAQQRRRRVLLRLRTGRDTQPAASHRGMRRICRVDERVCRRRLRRRERGNLQQQRQHALRVLDVQRQRVRSRQHGVSVSFDVGPGLDLSV